MFRFFVVLAVLFVATAALADSKDGARFMRDMQIVYGDEACEKAVLRYALNCPADESKFEKLEKKRKEKCAKFGRERKECLLRNTEKKEKN